MPTRAPKQRLPGHERRELIVEAGLAEFASRGYEAASLGRIAQAAGVARTVLYDHFPSKQALFAELLRTEHGILLDYQRATLGMSGSTEERWRATFDAFFAFYEERSLAWQLLFPAHPPVAAEAAEEFRRARGEYNRMLAELLTADARRAGLDPETIRARAVLAIHRAALEGAVRWWQAHPGVSRTEIVDASMAALWTGFGGLQPAR